MSSQEIAQQFVRHYYTTFDTNRPGLQAMYQANSKLTFEGQMFEGPAAIAGKLMSLGGASGQAKVVHQAKSIDVQPSTTNNAMLIFVSGDLTIDSANPLKFSEMFQLVSTGPGQFYVHNCIFRLNYS
eukprot:GSMAST32.ASY1.ANO1.83.1 assembled CDS